MPVQDGLLVALVLRYEEDRDQFVILSRQTVDSSSARLAIAGLRNEGLVEEQVRGVIRLTALGVQKVQERATSIRLRGLNRYSVRASKHGRSSSVFGSYTCLGNLA